MLLLSIDKKLNSVSALKLKLIFFFFFCSYFCCLIGEFFFVFFIIVLQLLVTREDNSSLMPFLHCIIVMASMGSYEVFIIQIIKLHPPIGCMVLFSLQYFTMAMVIFTFCNIRVVSQDSYHWPFWTDSIHCFFRVIVVFFFGFFIKNI